MKRGVLFSWIFAGFTICAGVVLIGLGISFMVTDNCADASPPTCGADSCGDTSVNVEFDMLYMRLKYLRSNEERNLLSVNLGQTPSGDRVLGHPRAVQNCFDEEPDPICSDVTYTVGSTGHTTIRFTVKKIEENPEVTCFDTMWDSSSDNAAPVDCFQMSDFWFGGAEMYYQDWPINSWNKHMSFYLSGDMFADDQQYGSVLERYWLSSKGVALWVPANVPLHVSTERQQICFKGAYESPYHVRNANHSYHWLQYTTCFAKSPQIVHDYMFTKYFARPPSLPDVRMIQSPIWSTWARYKVDINQSVVLTYADEILEHGFSNSQLEIDDGYEVFYGDHTFDTDKFPDASQMISTLHDLGFRVTTWVTPFINLRSNNYEAGDANKYYVINGNTDESGRVPWWNGVGSSIDFTNWDACDWYASLLENVKSTYGVDSFKFDAGEINYVTVVPNFKTSVDMENIGTYTQRYGECAFSRLGTQIELRAAWNCQRLPVFVRMMDKDSNWGPAKGLKTLIPTALTFSLLGYPYILPDMIGGNAYEDGFHGTPLPERELYIRWLELTAFMPSMQFSYVPWQYDNETVEIAKKYVTIHENEVYDEIIKSSNDYINRKSGLGPIRPIWWVTVDDNRAFQVDDEFMVGDRYLVAPIVNNATRSRDIYLPGPLWRDGDRRLVWDDKLNKRGSVLGGTTLYDYPIELDEISWWELRLA